MSRTTMRAAFKSAVSTALGSTWTVEFDRRDDVPQSKLPLAAVYTPSEDMEMATASGLIQHSTEVAVELHVKKSGTTPIEQTLDAAEASIQTQLETDTTLGGTALTLWPTRMEYNVDGSGDVLAATGIFTYTVRWDD